MRSFLAFLALVAVAAAAQTCPAGEVWSTCGKACESTCDRPNFPCVMMICMSGCVCQEGTHRHLDSGKCMTLDQCPATATKATPVAPIGCTGDNEIFKECAPLLDGTCIRPDFPRLSLRCRRGCTCADGYLRDTNGKCVKQEECPNTPAFPIGCANTNEVFNECGPLVEATCANPQPAFMSLRCKRGCFCAEGYVRNAKGDCVKKEDCSTPMVPIACAGENEVYKTCGPLNEPSCARPNPVFISLRCKQGCFCADGFTRNAEGKCVKKEDCVEKQCAAEEEFSQCVPVSQPTCSNPTPMMISLRCFPGCKCPEGHYRNVAGKCVTSEMCGDGKKCIRDRAQSSKLPGAFTPVCNDDGSYASKQCHSSTGFCWCVDNEGHEVVGSRKGPSEGPISC